MAAQQKSTTQSKFINRELSWLEFNQRVLDEALDPKNPLLERLKYFCITSSNLDEFFEVRVAGIKQQIESNVKDRSADGLTPRETLKAVTQRIRRLVGAQYRCWNEQLLPALSEHGIRFLEFSDLDDATRVWVEKYYRSTVDPVLTPLAVDHSHPFPHLLNKSLNIVVQLEIERSGQMEKRLAVVQVPRPLATAKVLPRLIRLPNEKQRDYIFLGAIIGNFLGSLFPGTRISGYWNVRVTRNSEFYFDEEDAVNLLQAVEEQVHKRRKGDAVRLEVERDCPLEIRAQLLETLGLEEEDLYVIDGPLNAVRLMSLYEGEHSPELRDPRFVAPNAAALREKVDLFEEIHAHDVVLHHPYESFDTVVEFVQRAAADPDVLAIKQTLYRTGGDPSIVGALIEAVRNGKQVTAVVELKARFDEARNIEWTRKLEEAGVHVVYGLVGMKIHCKMTLVVRREDEGIRRYLHLSTGNYNPATSKVYTDIGLFTSKPAFGEDATTLFNLLTGVCQFPGMRKLLVAPFELRQKMLGLIEREAKNAATGVPARIIAKMNALVDREIIEALYQASSAGVKIDLIVRGVCCLRPGVQGVSENITVRSIVDRFLEHSRIFYFENGCQPEVFVGSADWMPRNLDRRIEVVFPIEDGNLRERLTTEILGTLLADNTKARHLQASGAYRLPARKPGAVPCRSQAAFMELALQNAPPSRRKRKSKLTLAKNPLVSP